MSCFNINPEVLKEFGRLIKLERERRRDESGNEMSQRKLAKIANVSNSTISRIENGTINSAINLEVFLAIAEAINLTDEQIIVLYKIATYKYDKIQSSLEQNIKREQNEYINKLGIEINVLKTLRVELDNMIDIKTEIQKVNQK